MDAQLQRVSRFLSFVLRHRPDAIGITLDEQGWVAIDSLLVSANEKGENLTRELIEQAVWQNSKQRFALSPDRQRIRANQGHSVEVDLGLPAMVPPEILYHGTAQRNLPLIESAGLLKMSRQHVHLSGDFETAAMVGRRHGEAVVLQIKAAKMSADGHTFYRSENGVWLTDHVPVSYLVFPITA